MKNKKDSKKIDKEQKRDYNQSEDIVVEELSDNDALKKLRDKLKICVEEKQGYLEGWQRAKADFVNYKKDEEERKAEILRFAKEAVIEDILPVLDSLAMSEGTKAWEEGLEQVNKQLLSVLQSNGLEEINPQGEDFDPSFHEAVEMVEGEKRNDGKVVEVVQFGYLLNKKIIRPSRVKVGKFEK